MSGDFLPVPAVAEDLGVSSKTVYRMTYAGVLAAIPVGLGKTRPRVRIARAELERYKQERKQAAEATRPTLPPVTPPPPAGPVTPPPPAGPKVEPMERAA
jgi:excisionase family DNA binding protein